MDRAAIPYILLFATVSALGVWLWGILGFILAILGLLFFVFTLFFFRDPKRSIPNEADAIVSPADGKIVSVDAVEDPAIGNSVRISIFMSPLNVHINRSPVSGEVVEVMHYPGRFHRAFREEASLSNERTEMVLSTSFGKIKVKQIAGIIARRIVCRARVGERLSIGQKYGLIHFGSRVELYLPAGTRILVRVGQKVVGGETIVARITR